MSKIITFFKNWALPVSMLSGVAAYFVFHSLNLPAGVHRFANEAVSLIQPMLLFCMLFLSFCKVDPRNVRLRWWHLWIALIQCGSFIAMALFIFFCHCGDNVRLLIESAMLCLICPTATAAVVITDKLGGNTASLVAYTIIINIATAVVISLFVPLINPAAEMSFWQAFSTMIIKVFSLLVLPLVLALIVRYHFPKFREWVTKPKDLAFYLWTIALALALAVTTKAIVHSHIAIEIFVLMGLISLFCCILQFFLGKKIGGHYQERIAGGQAFGQKNTVFLIWVAYSFMSPVTAIVGGLYSIWHNLFNSWQLYRKRIGKSIG